MVVVVEPSLWLFLSAARRAACKAGGIALPAPRGERPTVGHLVQALGVPLTEVGALLVDDVPVPAAARVPEQGRLVVAGRERPQPMPTNPPRFVADVHLGVLVKRLRLLGLDTAYSNVAGDAELVALSAAQQRVLLTRDRGLLMRRGARWAAFVRGQCVDDQLADVLGRFAPALHPWTRCVLCNGTLKTVDVGEIADQLKPGTRRNYTDYARCRSCGRAFWRGAHAARLEAAVAAARGHLPSPYSGH